MTAVSKPNGAKQRVLGALRARAVSAPRHPFIFATAMTGLAGFLDAVGYIELQHLFVSFMSGNSTHLGTSVGRGDWIDVLAAGVVIASFVAGAFAGTLLADWSARFAVVAVLDGEFALLLLATTLAAGGQSHLALMFVAFAMGMQNTLHQVVAGADLGKGFITGALFALGQSLARWTRGKTPFVQAAANFVSWAAFIGGAAIGTVVLGGSSLVAALGSAAALAAIAVAATGAGVL